MRAINASCAGPVFSGASDSISPPHSGWISQVREVLQLRPARKGRMSVHERCELILSDHPYRTIAKRWLVTPHELLASKSEFIIGLVGDVRAEEYRHERAVLFESMSVLDLGVPHSFPSKQRLHFRLITCEERTGFNLVAGEAGEEQSPETPAGTSVISASTPPSETLMAPGTDTKAGPMPARRASAHSNSRNTSTATSGAN
jgi:hypothetical protein